MFLVKVVFKATDELKLCRVTGRSEPASYFLCATVVGWQPAFVIFTVIAFTVFVPVLSTMYSAFEDLLSAVQIK